MDLQADDLYRIRNFYKLTQAELASICNVSEPYINMIERNKRALTDPVKTRLINGLDLTSQKLALIDEAYQILDARRNLLKKGLERNGNQQNRRTEGMEGTKSED